MFTTIVDEFRALFWISFVTRRQASVRVGARSCVPVYLGRSVTCRNAFDSALCAGIWGRLSIANLGLLLAVNAALLAFVLVSTTVLARRLGFGRADEIAIVFCGSKKSLASGLPMASVLFPAGAVGLVVLPLMLFHQMQLMVCAWLARRYVDQYSHA